MTNRNPIKQVFITLPHSHIDKSTLRDFLLQFSPEYYKVCEEKHKDGTPHLHAVVKFVNKYSCAHIIKQFKNVYPDDYKRLDVKPVRSIKRSIEYLSKEDSEPLTNGEFVESRNPTRNALYLQKEQFALVAGYPNYDSLLRSERETEELHDKAMSMILEEIQQYHGLLDVKSLLPLKILSIRRKILSESIFISKNDITSLIDFYKINLNIGNA